MREVPVSPFSMSKWRYGHFLNHPKKSERGKEKQMRSMMTNRMNAIQKPAACGFTFVRFSAAPAGQPVIAEGIDDNKDQGTNWDIQDHSRYRRT